MNVHSLEPAKDESIVPDQTYKLALICELRHLLASSGIMLADAAKCYKL